MSPPVCALLSLIAFLAFASTAQASSVPASATFKYVNQGEFGDYIVEYDASYRHSLDIFTYPYQLMFYNTTPNQYYLGLLVGSVRSTSLRRWVWEFNRGNPVRENATFSLGTDGNLVLADADGRVAWQSGTANKGVVGFQLLSNGNMVLHDAKGKYVWQSFDYPTDTLLVGQPLRVGGPTTLVSRASTQRNVNGPYSLVLGPERFALYYKSKNSPKPQIYYDLGEKIESVKLDASRGYLPDDYEISLQYKYGDDPQKSGGIYMRRNRYNSTVTYLRLGIDGTLKVFTFDQEVDISAWQLTYDLFSPRDVGTCKLPQKCGNFGLCENEQCVACPSPNGLLGWSQKCNPPKLPSCKNINNHVKYYKLVGVDHFVTSYNNGDGPMKESDCSKKCTSDCKCAGYFFHQDKSMCWTVYDLMTLSRVADKKHLGYIKM